MTKSNPANETPFARAIEPLAVSEKTSQETPSIPFPITEPAKSLNEEEEEEEKVVKQEQIDEFLLGKDETTKRIQKASKPRKTHKEQIDQ